MNSHQSPQVSSQPPEVPYPLPWAADQIRGLCWCWPECSPVQCTREQRRATEFVLTGGPTGPLEIPGARTASEHLDLLLHLLIALTFA